MTRPRGLGRLRAPKPRTTGEGACVRLDPLGDLRRTHFCGDLRPADVGREVVLCGWVRKRRDHGGVIFVDLRDRSGLLQVVFKPDTEPAAHEKAQAVRSEWVLIVRGMLARRDPDVVNPPLPTGEVELLAHEVRILNTATTPPFEIEKVPPVSSSIVSLPSCARLPKSAICFSMSASES